MIIPLTSKSKVNNIRLLTYQGDRGTRLIRSEEDLQERFVKTLPYNIQRQIGFTGGNLSTLFPIKDHTKLEYQHDIIHEGKYPEENCIDNHIGETAG